MLDPRSQGARVLFVRQLAHFCADILDLQRGFLLFVSPKIWCAAPIFSDPSLCKIPAANLRKKRSHFLPRRIANNPGPGGKPSPFSSVADSLAHACQATLNNQVNDQLSLMEAFEI